ncbi:hypothetical protein O3P69_020772 [Scylla paramamosain]|uniref:Secreted protein n=1 Tax=Scylla paramamosain TaxID=85552 RepID=A0AAW0TRQ3_SCYPA
MMWCGVVWASLAGVRQVRHALHNCARGRTEPHGNIISISNPTREASSYSGKEHHRRSAPTSSREGGAQVIRFNKAALPRPLALDKTALLAWFTLTVSTALPCAHHSARHPASLLLSQPPTTRPSTPCLVVGSEVPRVSKNNSSAPPVVRSLGNL